MTTRKTVFTGLLWASSLVVVAASGAVASMSGSSVPALPVVVNPVRAPLQITVEATQAGAVSVSVVRPDGQVAALLGPVVAGGAGPVRIGWPGGSGPAGTGMAVSDGEYGIEGAGPDGTPLAVFPASVRVDTRPPAARLVVPPLTVPLPLSSGIPLRVSGDRGDVLVRAVVRRVRGRLLATGRWMPASARLRLPPALVRSRVVGLVSVRAEARDAAGNRARSAPVVWALPPPAGPPVVVRHIRTARPLVAVTVDDGYDPWAATRMLRAARTQGVTITFCFNAVHQSAWSAAFRALLRRAVVDGVLETCNHGYSHTTSASTGERRGVRDLTRNADWDRITGSPSAPFYRPPYGAFGAGLLAAARDLRYRYVLLWDVDTNDWRGPSPATIVQRAVWGARRGSIILMHARPNTAAAFPDILRGLRQRGLRPVGLGELFSAGRPG